MKQLFAWLWLGILLLLCQGALPWLADPAHAQDDPLGVVWQESEGGGSWQAVWTRRGSTSTFDASWNSGRVTAVLMISRVGDQVTVARRESSDGNNCDYTGTVSGASVSGTYYCGNGGPYEWSATIGQGFAAGTGTVSPDDVAQCTSRRDAQDELVLRARAAQATVAMLLELRTALDAAYEANREQFVVSGTLDAAMLAAGWPMGKALQEWLLGKAENTFAEKLLKAGLKAVEKNLIRDALLEGAFREATLAPSAGLDVDVALAKEAVKIRLKDLLGEQAAMSVFVFYDLMKFSSAQLKGMNVLDAYRHKINEVELNIRMQEQLYRDRVGIAEAAVRAVDQCLHSVSLGSAPDPAEYNWQTVQAYLGAN